jgi:general secretion pathway protein K
MKGCVRDFMASNPNPLSRLLVHARGRRGLALVAVLWVLMLLSLVAASFMATTRTEVNLTRNQIENARAEALADAGVYRALLGLLAVRGNFEAGDDVARVLESGSPAQENRADEPAFPEAWRSDGTVYAWSFGGGAVRMAIQDEAGKIDLNGAADELLRGLFLAAEWTGPDGETVGLDAAAADALTDAVRDFADTDDLKRLNGAEDDDYAAAGLPWGAKDTPFAAVEELQQVLGMTPPLYRALAPALTVHTGSKGVDTNSAPRAVLLALPGGEAAAVDAHLAARAEAPKGAGPAFLGAEGLSARSRGRVYTIRAEGRSPGAAVFAREAVVRLGGGARGFRIEAWKQGRRILFAGTGAAADPED